MNIEYCKGNCKRILTTEQMNTTKLCAWCAPAGKKHDENFHKKFDIKPRKEETWTK